MLSPTPPAPLRARARRWFHARRSLVRLNLAVSLMLLAAAPMAHAGQLRIDVASDYFSPDTPTVNAGDQVVWIWTQGFHSVTSGIVDMGVTEIPDGIFDTGNVGTSAKSTFSWKAPATTGTIPYYCIPHGTYGMTATLAVVGSGQLMSSMRITEVRWTAAHDQDFIEIANLGTAAGDLGYYRLSVTGSATQTFALRDMPVPVNGRVVLRFNQSGANNAAQLFLPGLTLGPSGSAALYAPCTISGETALTNDKLMVDYVQWGTSGQQNETTANVASYWATGTFVPAVADGHSIEFCGTTANRGSAFWNGSPTPTPGTVNCTTPAVSSTWGRVKALYR